MIVFVSIFLLMTGAFSVSAQEIITAESYLAKVAERYAGIRDYEAGISIVSGSSNMSGTVSHITPSFLRLDFNSPAEQVIVFNGEQLTIYLPEYRAVLNQAVTATNRPAASMASAQGLTLLRRNYVSSYITVHTPQPLDSGSSELVIKLRLTRRSAAENFREITLCINPDTRLIRRIEGRTNNNTLVRFDFYNVRINQGIPEQRFIYDSPASANMYNNFLFRDTN